MPYLIDGHNLIPKLGLQLDAIDDELELIEALQVYSRQSRRAIEVFFDGAPAGHAGIKKFGRLTAHFVSQASTADAAIKSRLGQLGGSAKNWTVVSSDREVLVAAAAVRARSETSEQFADRLRHAGATAASSGDRGLQQDAEGGLSDQELQNWLDLFKNR